MQATFLLLGLAVAASQVWPAPTSTSQRSKTVSSSSRSSIGQSERSSGAVYTSAGARRLHLLTRPFGLEYHSSAETTDPLPKKARLKLNDLKGKAPMKADTDRRPIQSSTSEPSSSGPTRKAFQNPNLMPRIRSSGVHNQRWHRLKSFEEAWKKHGLSTDLDAVTLADKVLAMGLEGANTITGGILASDLVRAKGDPYYEANYHARLQSLNRLYYRESQILERSGYLLNLDEKKKKEIILAETYKSANKQDQRKKRKYSKPSEGPISANRKANEAIERVGAHIKKHLEDNNLDFYKMPLFKLEEKTRNLSLDNMHPAQFSRSLFQYIQVRRGEKEQDMNRFKRIRRRLVHSEKARLERVQARASAGLAIDSQATL
jgi:hypothetical protein